ncbi:hypothetical protein [Silvanigrella aquatica]|uniref:Uncharacterized protein n=1 Tax=Silvanigrella aquatica TaxID=1915309 RepID=A0A1L4CXS1_9BACT|nr:hypothetical protein [Silvanigrella aquatica]APJ02734.1 hypothetical protein AXG55_01850 [Silvanigrella aquatica]
MKLHLHAKILFTLFFTSTFAYAENSRQLDLSQGIIPSVPGYYPETDGFWGDWGFYDKCPLGQFVDGYTLLSEEEQINGDNTTLNGIVLHCSGGARATSSMSKWGSWVKPAYCNGPVKGFAIQIKPQKGNEDDTAANDLMLVCNNNSIAHAETRTHWGHWSHIYYCPTGQVILGLITRVEKQQYNGDDTALNGVRMICGQL